MRELWTDMIEVYSIYICTMMMILHAKKKNNFVFRLISNKLNLKRKYSSTVG